MLTITTVGLDIAKSVFQFKGSTQRAASTTPRALPYSPTSRQQPSYATTAV
jgi:hypothetical protein